MLAPTLNKYHDFRILTNIAGSGCSIECIEAGREVHRRQDTNNAYSSENNLTILKSLSQKQFDIEGNIFEEEMLIRSLPTSLLQIFWYIILNLLSKVS